MLPSSDQTTTMPSAIWGGPAASLEILACHFGLPAVSKVSTSALLVPTAIRFASAPMPPDKVFPAALRQFWRPVAASTLSTAPSGLAAYTASVRTAGANPALPLLSNGTCQFTRAAALASTSGSGPILGVSLCHGQCGSVIQDGSQVDKLAQPQSSAEAIALTASAEPTGERRRIIATVLPLLRRSRGGRRGRRLRRRCARNRTAE